MIDPAQSRRFEALALPHVDAAYNLARWLTGNDEDAREIAQESAARALRHFASFRGENARPWLLHIVRRTCFAWGTRQSAGDAKADESTPVSRALAQLPIAFREVLVLRELEDLSYREIAAIAQVPVGTVVSRLAQARHLMRAALAASGRPALRAVGGRASES